MECEKVKCNYYVKNKDLLIEIAKFRETHTFDSNGKPMYGTGKMNDTLRKNDL